ncbi:MAG TPA: TolC family protein [Pirellulaceae bacterium]|nr:TolC family protein [Pirellulaceae bacterium]
MRARTTRGAITAAIFALALSLAPLASAQPGIGTGPSQTRLPYRVIYPGQRTVQYRDPSQFPFIPLQPSSPPPTVSRPPTGDVRYLSLDDAIRICLENDDVIRVLTGVTAVASGRTIYDPAIVNTTIDEQQARFDPFLNVSQAWDRFEPPSAVFVDPNNPAAGTIITGVRTDDYDLNVGLSKQNPLGGQWDFGLSVVERRFQPGIFPLNPQTTSATSLAYTQPFLKGAGMRANLAPVVLARIDTERSFFQLKSAVQDQVQSLIDGYWNLVAARVDVWAIEQQIEQAEFAYRLAAAEQEVGRKNASDKAQALSSLSTFRANLISAKNLVLQREAALRNLLGLPPWDEATLVPSTEPVFDHFEPDWLALVDLAAQRRPDLIELKLILEADEQQLIIANNQALPQLDAVGLYRWNGLSGELPTGNGISSGPGQFTDWTLGVNFSVPLGLRQARAVLRQRELVLARDRANLDQGLHAASHDLATTIRSLDQAYEQFLAFRAAREAARENLRIQEGIFRSGFRESFNFLNVLVAMSDWGNSVRAEAAAVAEYNSLLAELERQTGTILETHGVRFYEERYGSIGPLGRLARPVCYPESTPPTLNYDRYPPGDRPAEQSFNLKVPVMLPGRQQPPPAGEEIPPPAPQPRLPRER